MDIMCARCSAIRVNVQVLPMGIDLTTWLVADFREPEWVTSRIHRSWQRKVSSVSGPSLLS